MSEPEDVEVACLGSLEQVQSRLVRAGIAPVSVVIFVYDESGGRLICTDPPAVAAAKVRATLRDLGRRM